MEQHRAQCAEIAALPSRDGALTEKFLQKPGVRKRAERWRVAVTVTCLLCGGRDNLGRSGVVLCLACHDDFVLGNRPKKKPPPPVFRIEEWVSAEDMKVVRADREECRRIYKDWFAPRRVSDSWERMIAEMCRDAPDDVTERCFDVWDNTREWQQVIETFERGGQPTVTEKKKKTEKPENVINSIAHAMRSMESRHFT